MNVTPDANQSPELAHALGVLRATAESEGLKAEHCGTGVMLVNRENKAVVYFPVITGKSIEREEKIAGFGKIKPSKDEYSNICYAGILKLIRSARRDAKIERKRKELSHRVGEPDHEILTDFAAHHGITAQEDDHVIHFRRSAYIARWGGMAGLSIPGLTPTKVVDGFSVYKI